MERMLTRTLYYRRAQWRPDFHTRDLAALLEQSHQARAASKDRTFKHLDDHYLCGADGKCADGAFYGRVVRYSPDQPTSVISKPNEHTATITPAELPPPPEKDYLTGDIFFVARKNHLVFCTTNSSESALLHYFDKLVELGPDRSILTEVSLIPVIPFPIHQVLKQGIKKITLKSTVYSATAEQLAANQTQTTVDRLLAGVRAAIAAVSTPPNLEVPTNDDAEDLSMELVLFADGRRKGAEIGYERLRDWFAPLADQHDADIVIETANGSTVKQGELKIQKAVKLPPDGSTTECEATWGSLRSYLDDLESSGELAT